MKPFRSAIATARRAYTLLRVARMASRMRSEDPQTRVRARAALAGLLADARGVPMKVGQHLAGLSSDADDSVFEPLLNKVTPLGLDQARQLLKQQWGCSPDHVLQAFKPAQHAASLGQVHWGRLRDGTEVAIKIRYPRIVESVEAELRLAGLMPTGLIPGAVKKWGFDIQAYRRMLKTDLDHELNYLDEAARQQAFARQVRVPSLVVPRVYNKWCRPGVLVQSWEASQAFSTATKGSVTDRREIGRILLQTLFVSLFGAGQVHADPHAGNLGIRWRPGHPPVVVLMDFGCTACLDTRTRLALLKLIEGCRRADDTEVMACLVAMGFEAEKLHDMAEMLPALCRLLFEPFETCQPFNTRYWNLSERMDDLLGELRWWFRAAAPASLLFVLRAFSGLVQHLNTLGVMLSWSDILDQSVDRDVLSQARAYTPESVKVPSQRKVMGFDALARYLKIQVTERGRQIVAVTLPASQVTSLAEHMPQHVMEKLNARKIDVSALVHQVCRSGLAPQEIFTLEDGTRGYRVWLQ